MSYVMYINVQKRVLLSDLLCYSMSRFCCKKKILIKSRKEKKMMHDMGILAI